MIARPTKLSDRPATGHVEATAVRPPGPISVSRADVTQFIATELVTNTYLRQAVFIVSAPWRQR